MLWTAAMPNALKGFRANDPEGFAAMQRADLDAVKMPYIVIATIVIAVLDSSTPWPRCRSFLPIEHGQSFR